MCVCMYVWGGTRSRETVRNLKLFDAVARLKTSRPLSFQHRRSTPPTRFVQPNVFDVRDDRNRGVWRRGQRGDDCREKVCFTTDLLSRHARILSKLGDSEGEGRHDDADDSVDDDDDGGVLSRFTRGCLADLRLFSPRCIVTQSCGRRNNDSFPRARFVPLPLFGLSRAL